MTKRSRSLVPVLLASIGLAVSLEPALSATPDFAEARAEAVRLLQELIRIDTSNPPGNETKAAEYLKGFLDREGVPSELLTLEPGRGNLVARLRGNGAKRPLLIMGHTDVVGVERDKWTVDPFAGLLKDGYLYGRGAVDDKDTVAAGLIAFLLIHRQKLPLERDVIYLAEAGEEGTSQVGIAFMVDKHWDKIDCEFALAEGGTTALSGGRVKYVGVATTEKVPNALRLVARGTSGHGSRPRVDNPIVHLAAAVAKLQDWQPRMRLNETTRTFFKRMAAVSPPEEAFLYAHLEDPAVGAMVQETLRRTNIGYNSMLRTSISPTIIKGGFRSNVIPAEAEVTLDVRALPEEDMGELVEELRGLINDPAVEIVRDRPRRPAPPPSRLDSEMFQSLERAQATLFPGAVTLPMMLTGATDMAQLRAKGVQAYGVGGPTPEDDSGAHGNDERIGVEALGQFVELIYRAVAQLAASGKSTSP